LLVKKLLLVSTTLILSVSSLHAQDTSDKSQWVEGTQAADDGATRDYYNRAARLAWDNYMGDWWDANDVAQGDAPYSTATLIDDNTPEYIEWDVTGLVQEWVDGDYPNKGLLVRAVSGSGTFNFYSREHSIASQRPELVVVTASGTNTLAPKADVYLDTSTYQCLGDLDTLRISDSSPTLLCFDLSGIDNGTEITSATLRLYVYAEYGGGTLEAGVFRCSQGHELPPSDPIPGLAAQYPHDQGIETHSDVHLFSDFETADWGSDWTFGYDASTLETVVSDSERLFAPFQGTALRVEIPEGANTGMSMGYDFADEIGQEPEEIYFRYYLRISDDWETTYGGKMPGISGTYGRAGWGGRPSDGTNGWSARGSFDLMPPPGNPLGEMVPLGHYVYHADMEGIYGDVDLWQNDYRGYLEKNRWYCIEQYLQMNTPGQNDGILRAWVDGRLAYERTDWRWRDVDTLKIERIWMNVYHGGSATPDQDVHLYIDNVVIAKQYIGPMALDSLTLRGSPADQSIHLTWDVNATLPVTSTWQIDYQSQTGTAYIPITGIISPTRAYALTGLTNYTWYTVTLNGMVDETSWLSDTVRVMPTDRFVYLPVVLWAY
jgi:hypothetical protein